MGLFRYRRTIRTWFVVLVLLMLGVLIWRYQIVDSNVSKVLNTLDLESPITKESHDTDDDRTVIVSKHDGEKQVEEKSEESSSVSTREKVHPPTPLDADHIATVADEVVREDELAEVVAEPPELDGINIASAAGKYRDLFENLPTSVDKYCQLPYEVPRGHDGVHMPPYRLIGSYQLITPGASAPSRGTLPENGFVDKLVQSALRGFDCSLRNVVALGRLRMDFKEFREFLKTWRDDARVSDFVKQALSEVDPCEPGQLTPLGIAYHIELGESLAYDLFERERLLNSPEEEWDIEDSDPESYKQTWLQKVRDAVRTSFRDRVRVRATNSQASVIAALATMFGLAKRLEVSTCQIEIEVVDQSDRFCNPITYRDEKIDCKCKSRAQYEEEAGRQRDAQARFHTGGEDAKPFSTYRDVLEKSLVQPSQFETAARVFLSMACEKFKAGCVKLEESDVDEVCIDEDDLADAVQAAEFLERKWARERYTLTHSILTAFPYLVELADQWAAIAGPSTNFKMLDTLQRLGYKRAKAEANRVGLSKSRDFVALQLDFANAEFLTHVRRALNVSSIETSTRFMGNGQRLIFELYESTGRAPGELLVRLFDSDRELTQKSQLMCPKTYGGGLCQLSLIHPYIKTKLLTDTVGLSNFNKLCKPLKTLHYNV